MSTGENSLTPFGRYVRLYTLHRVEQPGDLVLLHTRIQTLRYSFAPLASMPLDAAYADDPREGAQMVRAVVLPRLQTLLDTNEPLRVLNAGGAQDALWRRYAAERGLPAEPVRIPIHSPAPVYRLPARSQTAERLARVQQALELVQTAVDTASTLAAAYQHWQIGREQRKLLEAQRFMLHDTIQAQISGQERALDRGLDRAYVRGYLADHAGDAVVDVLFGGDVG